MERYLEWPGGIVAQAHVVAGDGIDEAIFERVCTELTRALAANRNGAWVMTDVQVFALRNRVVVRPIGATADAWELAILTLVPGES